LAKFGLATPWEQFGLYGAILGGCTYAGRQYFRAHHVVKYVETQNVEHLYLANVPASEAPRAMYLVNRIRTRGVIAALGAPILWLAWRSTSGLARRSQTRSSNAQERR
jgi:hypothetical protein